jgi:hypothetical protein
MPCESLSRSSPAPHSSRLILIVRRYSVGYFVIGTGMVTVFGVDEWTGTPFMRQAPTK